MIDTCKALIYKSLRVEPQQQGQECPYNKWKWSGRQIRYWQYLPQPLPLTHEKPKCECNENHICSEHFDASKWDTSKITSAHCDLRNWKVEQEINIKE